MFDNTMTTTASYLGPARVVSVKGGDVRVRLCDEPRADVTARMALAFPYVPAVDDVLLIIGEESYYVIGVLSGAGRSTIEMPGDVDLRAVGGQLNLSGDQGVRVSGPEVTVRAGKLKTFADAVTEKVTSVYQWVKELKTVRAGQCRRVIDGEDYQQSKKSVMRSEGTVKIDGKQIHLGH